MAFQNLGKLSRPKEQTGDTNMGSFNGMSWSPIVVANVFTKSRTLNHN